jgi:hypothetical protein
MRGSIRKELAHLLAASLILAGCGGENSERDGTDPTSDPAQETTATSGRVERVSAAPEPAPEAPRPADAVIQTQEGSPGHIHVDLTRASVTGDVLTVQLRFRNTSDSRYTTVRFPIEEVSYIEDATARRHGVLVDEAGTAMASPVEREQIILNLARGDSKVAWFRFAAPDPQSHTISINIPGVGPFDGIPVTR